MLVSILVLSADLGASFLRLPKCSEFIFSFGLCATDCRLSVFEMPEDLFSVETFLVLSFAGFLRLVML